MRNEVQRVGGRRERGVSGHQIFYFAGGVGDLENARARRCAHEDDFTYKLQTPSKRMIGRLSFSKNSWPNCKLVVVGADWAAAKHVICCLDLY